MGPGGLRQGKVRSQGVTTRILDTPSTFRSISPEKSAQIFTHIAPFCIGAVDLDLSLAPSLCCSPSSVVCSLSNLESPGFARVVVGLKLGAAVQPPAHAAAAPRATLPPPPYRKTKWETFI